VVNKLLQIVALLGIENYILLFHVVTNVVVDVAKWLGDRYVHLFDFFNRSLELIQILRFLRFVCCGFKL